MSGDPREKYYPERMRISGSHYPGFDLASAEIFINLYYTQDVLHQTCAPYVGAYGLSKSSLNILMLLRHGSPEGMQLHDLGKLLLVSRANITGLIDHLEERGYVIRVVDPQDRRARFARITKKGETLLDEFMPLHYRNIKGMLQGLTADEKKTLVGLLEKTRASVAAHSVEMEAPAVSDFVGVE